KMVQGLADSGKAVLLITQDLETAWQTADRIAVFCGGTLVEVVNKAGFSGVDSFAHPYTRILWQALPVNGFEAGSGGGHGYNPNDEPKWKGCMFVDGCERAGTRCRMEFPDLIPYQNGLVRCLNA
ncbi:MAG: ABC transporter ATP-binding protein, partial [Candidatus Marinimicrobia bacterium]|nr:ABC transporter ATP-binding protein [Candidatus Neomarinimicrobiota bacterium]